MNAREFEPTDEGSVVELIAAFRVAIASHRGGTRAPDLAAATEELREYVEKSFPVFVAVSDSGRSVGYLVCRTDGDTVWAESLFVSPESRRRGVATALYTAAEQLAGDRGQPTLYNWIHPNNDAIIEFLRARGYDVLNLVEVRRPRPGEEPRKVFVIGDHEYRY